MLPYTGDLAYAGDGVPVLSHVLTECFTGQESDVALLNSPVAYVYWLSVLFQGEKSAL